MTSDEAMTWALQLVTDDDRPSALYRDSPRLTWVHGTLAAAVRSADRHLQAELMTFLALDEIRVELMYLRGAVANRG